MSSVFFFYIGHLPSDRSKCPSAPFLPMLCLFLVQYPSSFIQSTSFFLGLPLPLLPSIISLHYLSLQRVASHVVSYPVQWHCLGKQAYRKVVSRCLPLGVFINTPSLMSVSSTIHPFSSFLQECAVRLCRRSLGRPPCTHSRSMAEGTRVCDGVVCIWGIEAFESSISMQNCTCACLCLLDVCAPSRRRYALESRLG